MGALLCEVETRVDHMIPVTANIQTRGARLNAEKERSKTQGHATTA